MSLSALITMIKIMMMTTKRRDSFRTSMTVLAGREREICVYKRVVVGVDDDDDNNDDDNRLLD